MSPAHAVSDEDNRCMLRESLVYTWKRLLRRMPYSYTFYYGIQRDLFVVREKLSKNNLCAVNSYQIGVKRCHSCAMAALNSCKQ